MMFATKKQNCVAARLFSTITRAKKTSAPLCNRCEGREAELYLQKLSNVRDQQANFNQLWTECQRCQGSFHQEVICSNKDSCYLLQKEEDANRSASCSGRPGQVRMVKCTGGGKERDCRDEYLNLFMVQIDKLTFVVTCFSLYQN